MAKRPFVLGGIQFPTQKAAHQYVGDIRLKHEREGVGPITDPHERAVLDDLLKLHPRRALYEEVGVLGFDTWIVIPYGGAGFRVLLRGGVADPFSYRSALGMKRSTKLDVIHAFRSAINPYVAAWKQTQRALGPVICALSGAALDDGVFHADHAPPW